MMHVTVSRGRARNRPRGHGGRTADLLHSLATVIRPVSRPPLPSSVFSRTAPLATSIPKHTPNSENELRNPPPHSEYQPQAADARLARGAIYVLWRANGSSSSIGRSSKPHLGLNEHGAAPGGTPWGQRRHPFPHRHLTLPHNTGRVPPEDRHPSVPLPRTTLPLVPRLRLRHPPPAPAA